MGVFVVCFKICIAGCGCKCLWECFLLRSGGFWDKFSNLIFEVRL